MTGKHRANQHPPDVSELPLHFLIRGKWRLRILLCLADGPLRLSQLRKAIPGASKKVLVDNLQGLVRLGVIERHDFSTRIRRVEYVLSEFSRERVIRLLSALKDLEIDQANSIPAPQWRGGEAAGRASKRNGQAREK
jgi:DNA-binding HxlR family transcriptional regulator